MITLLKESCGICRLATIVGCIVPVSNRNCRVIEAHFRIGFSNMTTEQKQKIFLTRGQQCIWRYYSTTRKISKFTQIKWFAVRRRHCQWHQDIWRSSGSAHQECPRVISVITNWFIYNKRLWYFQCIAMKMLQYDNRSGKWHRCIWVSNICHHCFW